MYSNIKFVIFKLKWVLAFGVFVVAVGFLGEDCVVNRIVKQQEIARLKGEIAEYERKFSNDQATLNRFRTDLEAVKTVARERYFMKTDDEDIFIVEE